MGRKPSLTENANRAVELCVGCGEPVVDHDQLEQCADNENKQPLNMRIKQFAIRTLAVCLFSFLPNHALAFYNPQTGHWLSRDPIEEDGGVNLHAFVLNAPTCAIDPHGDKITSLSIRSSGKPDIEDVEYKYRVPEYDYFDQIITGDLGSKYALIPKHDVRISGRPGYGAYTDHMPATVAVGFKFEYRVMRCDVSDEDVTKGFTLKQTITRLTWMRRKNAGNWQEYDPGHWIMKDYENEDDGPSLKINHPAPGNNAIMLAGDMLRKTIETNDKWEYRLTVRWTVRAEDADNVFEGAHQITMIYDKNGNKSKDVIIQEPKEILNKKIPAK